MRRALCRAVAARGWSSAEATAVSPIVAAPPPASSSGAAAITPAAAPQQHRSYGSTTPTQHRVGDLPRSRSVQQEQLAEGSDSQSTAATGRPAAWPARSPDAPPDPATRRGGRETMPDEREAEEAARLTIRHGSGKSAEAILAGPEAAEAPHSNTAVKFVYQQQPSPYGKDVGVGTTPPGAAEQVARQDRETAGSGTEAARGGPTDDIPELGGMAGVFGPRGEMGAEYGLRTPRQAGSRGAPDEAGGGRLTESDMQGTGGGGGGGGGSGGGGRGGAGGGWQGALSGDGIKETVKAGVGRLQESYKQMFGPPGGPVGRDREPDREGAGGPSGSPGRPSSPGRHDGHKDGTNTP